MDAREWIVGKANRRVFVRKLGGMALSFAVAPIMIRLPSPEKL